MAEQLNWLTAGTELTWDMIVVDDGCPENSGGIAREIIVAEALESGHPLAQRLKNTSESMKRRSIQLGMAAAADLEWENHVIVFTDADLSTHLGQTGLLVDGIVGQLFDAAIGS